MIKNYLKIGLSLLLLAALHTKGMAQDRCTLSIRGQVFSIETNKPLAFANVAIAGTNTGTVSDEQGYYEIKNLCPGDYTLVCSMLGCTHEEHSFHLTASMIKDFRLHEEAVLLEKVTVTEQAIQLQNTQATNEIQGAELESTRGLPLAESLKRLPGVTMLNTGATIAKPVIQGLHSSRILILNNGIRQESQQWGSEHAPEIDPFIADKISVVKGAAGVRYGADAIGGVILVEPRALPEQPGIGGEFNLQGFSNGSTGVASGIVQGRLGGRLPLSGRMQGTIKRGGNLQTPDYFLNNTGVEEYNFSWSAGLKKEKFDINAFYSRFYTKIGIFRDSHIGNLTDLQNAIERERPLQDGFFSYKLGRPQQRISYELLKLSSTLQTGEVGKLNIQYARQFNRRQEFDAHKQFNELPNEISVPSIELELTTHTADLTWEHKPLLNLRGDLGLNFMQQTNTTDRGALIPDYDSYNASAFWIERWKNYPFPLELEAGVRYDYRWMSVGNQGRDTIGQKLNFSNISGTFGAIYKLPKMLTLRLNVGSAWRAPNVSELYSDGVHHGSASYEQGNPNLQPERALNTSLTTELNNNHNFTASLNIYYNTIQNFIFLEPRAQPQLTIRGAFPAFEYKQANARLTGLDWSMDYEFISNWMLESRVSLLRAWNRNVDDYLVFMPADRFQHGLKYTFNHKKDTEAPFLRFTMINVLKQTRVPTNTDYAPPPPGYARFDLEGGATFYWRKQPIEAGLMVSNLFNKSYREYLNRFRYFTDELGRNISLRIKVPFGLKS